MPLVQVPPRDGLIDQFRLMVHPVIVGRGKRLFKDGGDPQELKIVDSQTLSTSVFSLTYQPGRNEPK